MPAQRRVEVLRYIAMPELVTSTHKQLEKWPVAISNLLTIRDLLTLFRKDKPVLKPASARHRRQRRGPRLDPSRK